jgi:hypothetical protein
MLQRLRLWYGFRQRNPWVTRFQIRGRAYGGCFEASVDSRLQQFWRYFPTARRILELGSLEGGHTFPLAQRPGVEKVVGLEGRTPNLARARFVQRMLDCRNVEFLQADLETFDPTPLGRFDAVYCVGLLYHLMEPWKLLQRISGMAPVLFLSTHYALDQEAHLMRNNYAGRLYRELGLADPLSGLSPDSFWPTRESLIAMLRAAGYERIEVCDYQRKHPHGPLVNLATWMPNQV